MQNNTLKNTPQKPNTQHKQKNNNHTGTQIPTKTHERCEKKRLLFVFVSFFLLCFLLVGERRVEASEQAEARLGLQDVSINFQKKHAILLTSRLLLENEKELTDLLRDGAHLQLRCHIHVERVRALLHDLTVAEGEYHWFLRNDPLTREFMMYQENMLYAGKQLLPLILNTWNNTNLQIPLDKPLEQKERYRVTLTVSLRYAEVPPWLAKALYFWSWEVLPPVKFTQTFLF